jgi:predicted ATPase
LANTEYVFKHALTQEVAYNSLLIERRKLLHERAGQALESIFADQLDDHLTQLAHHYRYSENIDKAVEYLGRAGQQAIQRSAHADAINSLSTAIELLQKLPDTALRIQRELPLQLAIGPAFIAVRGWGAPEIERAFERARDLCEQLGDPDAIFLVSNGLWVASFIRADLRVANELAEQLERRAESTQKRLHFELARSALGQTSFHRGEFPLAREQLEMATSLYDPNRPLAPMGINSGVVHLSYAAWTLWSLGYADQAIKRADEAIALAESLSDPHSVVFAEVYVATLHLLRREARAAQDSLQHLVAISTEHGLADMLPGAIAMNGMAIAEMGGAEEGIKLIQVGSAKLRATGLEMVRPYHLCWMAEACTKLGRFDEGLSALAEALMFADEKEDRYCEAESYRLKGTLLLKQDDSNAGEAQRCFQRAIEIARKQSAKSWELRATMSLARLLASQGRREEARRMVADIYGWFTEGFDTADLIEAKALLDELAD